MIKVMWKEVENGEKLEDISVRDVGKRTFESHLDRLPGRMRVSKVSVPEWMCMVGRKMHRSLKIYSIPYLRNL